MKLQLLIFSCLAVLCVHAQRRTTARPDDEREPSRAPLRGRGRSRFSATPEYSPIHESNDAPLENTGRRIATRKRVIEHQVRTTSRPIEPSRNTYEVEEVVNESPIDPFKRQSKPRVLAEPHFEVAQLPRRTSAKTVYEASEYPDTLKSTENAQPETLPQIQTTQFNEISEELVDTTSKTNALTSEALSAEEVKEEFTRIQTITTPKPTESRRQQNNIHSPVTSPKPLENRRQQNGNRKNNLRTTTGSLVLEDFTTKTSRTRTRTRATRKPEEAVVTAAPPRALHVGYRRRTETPGSAEVRKGPSVFGAEGTQIETRSRTGRRIDIATPEKISIELPAFKSRDTSRRRTATPVISTTQRVTESPRRKANIDAEVKNTLSRTTASRGRFRSREVPPYIDEQKLEVLPLFAAEERTVLPPPRSRTKSRAKSADEVTKVRPRTRTRSSLEEMIQTSGTENEMKFAKPNEISSRVTVSVNVETRTESSIKRRQGSRKSLLKKPVASRKPVAEESISENAQTPDLYIISETSSPRPVVQDSVVSKISDSVRKPAIQESVVSEISQTTSRRVVTRRKPKDGLSKNSVLDTLSGNKTQAFVGQVVISSRGKMKSEINLSNVKRNSDSSEEIDGSENYPEPFKALIQAKKNKKVSRSSAERLPSTVSLLTNIVTSSTQPSTVVSSTSSKEVSDHENEVDSHLSPKTKSNPKSTRNRHLSTTRASETKTSSYRPPSFLQRKHKKTVRSTAQPPSTTPTFREKQYQSKRSSLSPSSSKRVNGSQEKSIRSFHYEPRGSYSKRRNKEERGDSKKETLNNSVDELFLSTKIPKVFSSSKKPKRYTPNYRVDISSRGVVGRTTTTSAPVYIPTIPSIPYVPTVPTITPPSSKVSAGQATKDSDLGLEIISFDDPVNPVPSANLVKGDYISSTENGLTIPLPLVQDGTTEKSISIIERIINSITAISTTPPPSSDFSKQSVASTTESSSAILKLANKKSTRLDKTKTDSTSKTYSKITETFTTEKPTTIIERILTSLSAIQATDNTNSVQVGKDFNTISSSATTPLSRVTKFSASSSTLPAQFSTSINPLSVFDEITPEQALQKRTIGKLLYILNGMVTSTAEPQNTVVVTPKYSNSFISSRNLISSTATVFPTTSDVTFPSTTTSFVPSIPETTPELFTSSREETTASSTSANTIESSTTSSIILDPTTSEIVPEFSSVPSSTDSSTFASTIPLSVTSLTSTTTETVSELPTTTSTITPTTENVVVTSTTPSTTMSPSEIASELSSFALDDAVGINGGSGTTTSTATVSTTSYPTTTLSLASSSFEITPESFPSTTANTQTPIIASRIGDSESATEQPEPITSEGPLSTMQLTTEVDVTTENFVNTQTTESSTITFPTTSEADIKATTETVSLFTLLSTLPSLQKFEVSPGSVSVFSANDMFSNVITPDDNQLTTVTIASRSNFDNTATTQSTSTTEDRSNFDNTVTTQSTITTEGRSNFDNTGTTQSTSTSEGRSNFDNTATTQSISTTEGGSDFDNAATTQSTSTTEGRSNFDNTVTTQSTSTTEGRYNFDNTATAQSTSTTEGVPSTGVPSADSSSTSESSLENASIATVAEESNSDQTIATDGVETDTIENNNDTGLGNLESSSLSPTISTTQYNTVDSNVVIKPDTTAPCSLSNRSGKLLNIEQDPIQNNIDFFSSSTTTSTTPDYFVFAVLNNNTILRKKPPTIPNKDVPFVIVGLYPDNTIVRKYPNGTLVPMEQIIRVRGFDTRENPPPLPEITSNQVTYDPGRSEDSKTVETADPNTVSSVQANPLSIDNGGGTNTNINLQGRSSAVGRNIDFSRSIVSSATQSSTTAASTTTTPIAEVTDSPSMALESSTSSASSSTLQVLSESSDESSLESINDTLNSSTPDSKSDAKYVTLQVNKAEDSTTEVRSSIGTTSAPQSEVVSSTTMLTTIDSVTTASPEIPAEPKIVVTEPTTLSNAILEETAQPTIATPTTTTTTTAIPTTTTTPATTTTTTPETTTATVTSTTQITTTRVPITPRLTSTPINTVLTSEKLVTNPLPTDFPTSVPTATFFPAFLTTLFPNLFPAEPSVTRSPRITTTRLPVISTTWPVSTLTETLSFAATSAQPSTVVVPTSFPSTILSTTTVPTTSIGTVTTTTVPPATLLFSTTVRSEVPTKRSAQFSEFNTIAGTTSRPTPSKLKQLTAEQKKNLETLAQLENEQAALLNQLSFLTRLNLGGANSAPKKSRSDLANRVIELAVEKDKSTTTISPPTSIEDKLKAIDASRQPKKVTPSIEDVLRQYNLDGLDIPTTPKSATYGKSEDALLAAILKEQGIAPPTPKSLGDQIKQSGIFSETTTRKPRPRPKATTQRPPGRLMQGLNWLLNALSPPPQTTRRPRPKPVKPKKPPTEAELLVNSPTHITPVVTAIPKPANTLTQDDIQKLIKQLEGLQKDSSKGSLDLSQIKSLQNLINTNEGVQVLTNGEHGTTSRIATATRSVADEKRQERKLTTPATLGSVSNSIQEEDEFVFTTAAPKPSRAPIGFRPVPGVDDGSSDPLIRSNLVTAAVNVTRAISTFLGSALQDAASQFTNMFSNGSGAITNFFSRSSPLTNVASASASLNPSG